jgi:hypothetical protein
MKKTTYCFKAAVLAIIMLCSFSSYSQTTQIVDFTATKDTYIRGKSDGEQPRNFGSCDKLIIDREAIDLHRVLLQFDPSGIPSCAVITSAELRLNCTKEKDMNVSVFKIGETDVWDEGTSCNNTGTSNWTIRTGTSGWSTPGVVGPYNGGTPIATINVKDKGIQSWNITSLVLDWLSGAAVNNGVMLGSQDGGDDSQAEYESVEKYNDNPPTLRITYTAFSEDEMDSDNDGLIDKLDIDDDNDGISDIDEGYLPTFIPLEIIQVPDHLGTNDVPLLFNGLNAYTGDGNLRIHSFDVTAGDLPGSILTNALVMGTTGADLMPTGTDFTLTMENDGAEGENASAIASDIVTELTDLGLDPNNIFQGAFNDVGPAGLDGSDFDRDGDGKIDTPGVDFSPLGLILQFYDGNPISGGSLLITSFSNIQLFQPGGVQQHTVTVGAPLTHFVVASLPDGGSTDVRVNEIQMNGVINTGSDTGELGINTNPPSPPDTDNDGVPDYLDLDCDNDGIPGIVEAGFGSISAGTATIPSASFVDTNNNGMHDSFEGSTPLDSDGDGIPNHQDLDSDNDAVFDVDESRTQRYVFGTLTFDNGDGDTTGDGAGDGFDSEAFRLQVLAGGCGEYIGDGILDIYDYGTGANEYGNLSQGSAPLYVNDEDGDGLPDYLDLDSNNDGVFDIAETHYAALDANNNGIIDDTTDTDGDGLLDLFDTDDSIFGSPRDLQSKFELYFDGRNDYLESDFDFSGITSTTVMAWIKLDPAFSNTAVIFNQGDFLIDVNASQKISAKINSGTVKAENSDSIELDTWYHVAVIFDSTLSNVKLYVNGELRDEKTHPSLNSPIGSSTEKFTIAKKASTEAQYFNGVIDEIRLFDVALTEAQLLQMMHQEIDQSGSVTKGSVIPVDISGLSWSSLKRYYRLDAYKDNVVDDLTSPEIDEGSGARIYNTKLIEDQTAPLPYVTKQSGRLDVAVNDPARGISGSDALNNKGAIIRIAHNDVYVESDLKQVGLMIDAQDASSNPIEFSVKNDSELNVSWFLELDGKLDLEGESQLVQGDGSILDADSSGFIEKDQQGTANSYNYNYWCSSVSPIGATGARGTASSNSEYVIGSFLHDGSVADNGVYPRAIDFKWHYTAADYGNSDPITISTYWLWKYHSTNDDYTAWQKIWPNTPLLPGEGYTMKGSSGSVPISSEQNYVFRGKPNNGDFTLSLTSGNDRLIGNPYPSAMDAEKFILDNLSTIDGGNNTNGNVFNGALYFWDHFGYIDSHYLGEYVGGYATRNIIGGTPAIANDQRINATGGYGTKIPGRYIPVNQGFFVLTSLDEDLTGLTTVYGGDVVFKNSQRVFKPETSINSVFLRSSGTGKPEDGKATSTGARVSVESAENDNERPLIRLSFDSPKGIHRQILVGADKNASNSFDIGYDALLPDMGAEDMFWTINDTQFVIQGVDNFDSDQELPLGLLISEAGLARIAVDSLENIDPLVRLYIKDKLDEETYDITDEPFEIELEPDEYYGRFSLVFQPRLKTLDEVALEEGINIFMNESNTLLQINRLVDTKIESIRLFNSLGQSLNAWDSNLENRNLSMQVNNMSTGMYIVQLETSDGDIIKKMLVD